MSFYLLNATRLISHRKPNTPMTKRQLFNMLIDYGAFKDSPILKFAVKNIIFEGFWTKAAHLYNDMNRERDAITRLKHHAKVTFGYHDIIIDAIFDSIWNTDEWDTNKDSEDLTHYLHFEGIPLTGSSFEFTKRLMNQGYSWNIYKRCLEGTFHGLPGCEISYNTSDSEVPLFYLSIVLPDGTAEDIATSLYRRLVSQERNRILTLYHAEQTDQNKHDLLFRDVDPLDYMIQFHKNKVLNKYQIDYRDGTGHGIMIESFLYRPHNNLATID